MSNTIAIPNPDEEPLKAEIILYQSEGANVPVQVLYNDETLWLTQAQMAELFDVQVPNISKHLTNIFDEGELDREATVSKKEIVRQEGNRQVKRKVDYYSLDAIIAVGYRVNSLICPEPCQQRRRCRPENLHKPSVEFIVYANAPADTPLQ